MTDKLIHATEEQITRAQTLLVMASLPPSARLDCEGIIALGIESQILDLIKYLENFISEKEAAYQEYKNTVKEALSNMPNKSA